MNIYKGYLDIPENDYKYMGSFFNGTNLETKNLEYDIEFSNGYKDTLIFRHYKTKTLIVNILSNYSDLYGDLIFETNTMHRLFSFTVTHDRYGLKKEHYILKIRYTNFTPKNSLDTKENLLKFFSGGGSKRTSLERLYFNDFNEVFDLFDMVYSIYKCGLDRVCCAWDENKTYSRKKLEYYGQENTIYLKEKLKSHGYTKGVPFEDVKDIQENSTKELLNNLISVVVYELNKDTKYTDIFKNNLHKYINKKLYLFIDLYMSELT